ncbi:MAG: PorV/PorQ family protein [Ignavibacteriales bacterium]|nr:MAG: PorV/PorQ family protein [Ignavibacteriales bacterium]
MKKLLLIFLLLVSSTFAQNPNLGTSGAQFLQIPVGARAEAMGGAIVGLTNDASSIFWNPAGLVKVNNVQAHFSYMNWFDLFDFNAASLVYNAGEFGVFGASMVSFTTGNMEITTEEEPNGTGRYFDAGDIALGVSYAKYLTDRFSVGLSVKYINQRIWNETASGVAFDIGTQYRLDFQNLTIAMSMTNFGADIKFDGPDLDFTYRKDDNYPLSRLIPSRLNTQEYPLPLNFQVGIGFDIVQYDFVKIIGAIDVTHPNDNAERAHFGAEFSFFDRFAVRGGYKYNYDDQDFTFGAGANVPLGGTAVYFDYAYSVYDILPSVHRISVNLSF